MQQFEREEAAAMRDAQLSGAAKSALTQWEPGIGQQSNAALIEQPGSGSVANSLAGLVHDARNVVAAMDLYCDLLAEPEVLSAEWRHYAADLRLVSGAGRRLLDKLAITAAQTTYDSAAAMTEPQSRAKPAADIHFDAVAKQIQSHQTQPEAVSSKPARQPGRPLPTPLWPVGFRPTFPAAGHESAQVERVREELRRILPLLAAIAGPGVSVEICDSPQDWPLPLSSEDFTRVMVNLVRNASEAMAGSGRIQIAVEETAGFVVLSVADEGPGIPRELMERVFQAGFSTRESQVVTDASGQTLEKTPAAAWPIKHRGLGLSIVRSIVSAARGTVWTANGSAVQTIHESGIATRAPDISPGGAVLFLEFPLPNRSSSH
jgi:hypothetical protein